MLWLALYCPTLALDCILRRWPAGLEPAMAVTETDGSRRFITAATQTAQACGVFAGQSVSTALALLPDLVVVARKLEDERRALIDAALAALRFTPTVSLRASGLVMEVSASLRLFGGRRAFRKSLADAMNTQGLGMAAAEAPTPHGAWLLARQKATRRQQETKEALRQSPGQRLPPRTKQQPVAATFDAALGAVPIALLESLESTWHRMTGIGVRTLRDLRRLPTSGLARRFGHELVDELARARGDKPDPQPVFEAPSSFEARIELMAGVDNAESLVFASQRLLEQMTGWLTARRAAVRGFSLVLHHERWRRDAIEPTIVPITVATPSNDHRRLLTLVRERLSRLELKAPVLELSIAAFTIIDEQEKSGTLFPDREKSTETLARLLEKLIARLGEEAMTRITRVEDHRPERAWREVPGAVLDEAPPKVQPTAKPTSKKRRGVMKTRERAGVPADMDSGSQALEEGGTAWMVTDAGTGVSHRVSANDRTCAAGDPGVNVDAGAAIMATSGADDRGIPARSANTSLDPQSGINASATMIEGGGIESAARSNAKADITTTLLALLGLYGKTGTAPPAGPGPIRLPIRIAWTNGPRPAWLLPRPHPLEMQKDRPTYEALPLALLSGPQRIEIGWWDDVSATRDYFIAQNEVGRLVWIYRERWLQLNRPLWYLQGFFG